MSKLLKQYNELKEKDASSIYIFRIGIFYNILNEDAKILNEKLSLKITSLSPEIIKCGFPISSLEKYTHLLESHNILFRIVSNPAPEYQISSYNDIIQRIQSIDLNNTTCKEAFDILYNIQQKLKNIQ